MQGIDLTRSKQKTTKKPMPSMAEQVHIAAEHIRNIYANDIDSGLILGSGLGDIPDYFKVIETIPYHDIPYFPHSTAPSHSGKLLIAELGGSIVAVFQGRFHLYEGWHVTQIVLGVYTLKALGASELLVTNAAGALNPEFKPGEVMLIEDHLNFTGQSPLIGQTEELGPRFPDMSRAYEPALLDHMRDCAGTLGQSLQSGIYAGVTGPALETSAERRFYRMAGADAIGMSTVPEVIAAKHCGLNVLGMSAITNMAVGDASQQVDSIEEVLNNAAIASQAMFPLLREFLQSR
ncbi:MAG: purine-nucleoside phosphorylase [Pseudomonadales bacterium]|nr:purine-nucleoside phosphorylase [Pseudomonadales bacterium]